jgi:hypothetical protein
MATEVYREWAVAVGRKRDGLSPSETALERSTTIDRESFVVGVALSVIPSAFYLIGVRVFTMWELLALSGSPRHPGGELALIWRLRQAFEERQGGATPILPQVVLRPRVAA